MSTLILIKGRIEVSARGYWFTSGGEKGSFGFYPHLKRDGLPIFPDTQIHGDLRMAANWLLRQNMASRSLVEKVFGKEGNQKSSLFSISDLELDDKSKWSPHRFSVKPRTEIDEPTRTNREKMLAFFEFSYLDGLTLEADFFMGYFKEESEAEEALKLLKKSLSFLSLGANRSRGCGRGTFKLHEEKRYVITQSTDYKPPDSLHFRYTITPLTNFRNRPINPGKTQLIRSQKLISARQMRGWFLRAFHEIYESWPSLEQISTIKFSSFYPSLNDSFAYPPPLSTLQLEDGSIRDFYKEGKSRDEENLVHSKPKPPKEGIFLTNETEPKVLMLKTEKRFRNSMDEKFVTKETGGLFAQELILRKQPFSGTISLEVDDDDFRKKAFFVLEKAYPKINGTFFEPRLEELKPDKKEKEVKNSSVFVLTEPLEFTKERWSSGIQFRLETTRGYNTTLRRPRRNRIVFAPGSLMKKEFDGRAIVWKGLNEPESDEKLKNMTRSQAGILRSFLEMDANLAEKRISDLLSKYGRWNKKKIDEHLIPEEYLKEAEDLLKGKSIEEFRQYIQNLLDKYVVTQWEKNQGEEANGITE